MQFLREIFGRDSTDPIAAFLRRHSDADTVALDVGANAGLYTQILSDRCKHVHAFEPNSEVHEHLRFAGRRGNVTLVPQAVSDRIGDVVFHIDTRPGLGAVASSINLLDDLAAAGTIRDVVVPCITIDAYCAELGVSPSLIKIDVEGHEFSVVQGGLATIRAHNPVIIFEFWENHWKRSRFEELFDLLHPMYDMTVVQTGADAWKTYKLDEKPRYGSVDIGCVPKPRNMSQRIRRLF